MCATPNSRRSTSEYIPKPEVVAIGGRRCGHHVGAAGRDAEAMACSMDRAGRALGGDLRRPEGAGRAYVELLYAPARYIHDQDALASREPSGTVSGGLDVE